MKKSESDIYTLKERFYAAANALHRYKDMHGFVPGVAVVAKFGDNASKIGIIADYGQEWDRADHQSVLVLFSNGRTQPWDVSDLTILKP